MPFRGGLLLIPPMLGDATAKVEVEVPLVTEMAFADMPKIYFNKVTV